MDMEYSSFCVMKACVMVQVGQSKSNPSSKLMLLICSPLDPFLPEPPQQRLPAFFASKMMRAIDRAFAIAQTKNRSFPSEFLV